MTRVSLERLKAVAFVLAGCLVALGASALVAACGGSSNAAHVAPRQSLPKPSVTVLSDWFTIPGDLDRDHNFQSYRVIRINGVCFVQADGAYQHTQLVLAQYAAGSVGDTVSVCDQNDTP